MENPEENGVLGEHDDASEVARLREELETTRESLKAQLQEAKQKAKMVIQKNMEQAQEEIASLHAQIKERDEARAEYERHMAGARDQIGHLQRQLEDEAHRREEMSALNGVAEPENMMQRSEETEQLRATVKDLEEQLGAKQAEITKTRDKAKHMLKEINQEKSELEEHYMRQVTGLNARAAELEASECAARADMEVLSKELHGAMTTVSQLQRSSHEMRKELSEASARRDVVEKQYAEYKERAKSALAEKDAQIEMFRNGSPSSEKEVEVQLLEQQERADKLAAKVADMKELEQRLVTSEEKSRAMEGRVKSLQAQVDEASEQLRNREAELIEEINSLSTEVELERGRVAAADARNAQAMVRLNVLEKSLEASEHEKQSSSGGHEKELTEARQQLKDLKVQSKKDREAAEAARRTVEAAMRAYADEAPGDEHDARRLEDSIAEMKEELEEAVALNKMYVEELATLKEEIRSTQSNEQLSQQLQDKQQFEYLKNVVIRTLEAEDPGRMLGPLATVLKMTPWEVEKVKQKRAPKSGSGVGGLLGVW